MQCPKRCTKTTLIGKGGARALTTCYDLIGGGGDTHAAAAASTKQTDDKQTYVYVIFVY